MTGSDGKFDGLGPRALRISRTESPWGLCLVGDLSSESAHLLTAALAELTADGGVQAELTLDLTDLTFVDTIGLHVIAQAAHDLDGRARVILETADPWLRHVLSLSGIDALPNVVLAERVS